MVVNTHESPLNYARIAGLLYLVIIVCGVTGELALRSALIVPNDAAQTASNILATPLIFHMAFVTDLLMLLADVAIAILLFQMFKSVNQTLSLTAMVFRLVQAAILGFNLLNYSAALFLVNGEGAGVPGSTETRHGLAMMYLNLHAMGYDLGLMFFAVSTLAMAYLLFRSSFSPSILSFGLIAAAMVYLSGSMVRFVLPQWVEAFEPLYIVPLIAELAFCFWLLSRKSESYLNTTSVVGSSHIQSTENKES